MTEEKKPTERAREHLERGFDEMFKAAESVADAVKREVKKSGLPEDLGFGSSSSASKTPGQQAPGQPPPNRPASNRPPAKGPFSGLGLGNLGLGNLGQALDDASRELVRAASNVATVVGTELETWGKRAQQTLDAESPADGGAPPAEAPPPPAQPGPTHGAYAAPAPSAEDWPKTREEYERKYGRDGEDWPKTREEYIEKYGRPPRPKDDDPGFRIATDDVK